MPSLCSISVPLRGGVVTIHARVTPGPTTQIEIACGPAAPDGDASSVLVEFVAQVLRGLGLDAQVTVCAVEDCRTPTRGDP